MKRPKKTYPRQSTVGKRNINKDYKEWRNKVLERDNRTCQICGSKRKLKVHHIRKFSEAAGLRLAVRNGISLCQGCHVKVTGNEGAYVAMFTRKVYENSQKLKEIGGEENEAS